MSKKWTVVTGGAGLIGSQIIEDLNTLGQENILVVDHLGTSEKWKNLRRNQFDDYMEREDFLNRVQNQGSFKSQIKDIYHLGACSSTTEKDATYLIHNNYEYTKILAEYAVGNNIAFLYASSAATYGEGEFGYDDKAPIQKLKPLNMYGYSKHIFDLYAERTGLSKSITGLKYFNVFGFGEAHKAEMRSLVLKGYEQILKTGTLQLFKSYRPEYKDGEQKRDFLYVKDASKISIYLLEQKKYGLFNVGRGIGETWNSLALAMFKALGLPISIQYVEMPEHLRGKYQYYTCANMDKLNETGYKLGFTGLEEAVADYVSLLQKET